MLNYPCCLSVAIVVKRRAGLMSIMDIETRWGSTHKMLDRLFQLRPVVDDLGAASSELHLSESTWKEGVV